MTISLATLPVKIFCDGADLAQMRAMYNDPLIRGFTTNPTLMRKAGVRDYIAFGREVLDAIPDLPVSFEVLSDDPYEMAVEAELIGSWGDNVYVKIPVTNTRGESSARLIKALSQSGIRVNVTAVMSPAQVVECAEHLTPGVPAIISVFAGRVADTGRDPLPMMADAVSELRAFPNVELLWASPREVLNIVHAASVGCHIITATADILAKRHLIGRDLLDYSLATVQMFYDDAKGLRLSVSRQLAEARTSEHSSWAVGATGNERDA